MPCREYVSLLMENQRRPLRLICAFSGNSEHAQDVLQETNLVLWEKAGDYDASRPFRPWAFRFAHNQVLAFRQKMQRDRLVFDEQMLVNIRDHTTRVTERLDDQIKSLDACVGKLSPRQQELIRRRYRDGQKLKEIAVATRQPANALAAMLFRSRQAIMRCMKAKLAVERDV